MLSFQFLNQTIIFQSFRMHQSLLIFKISSDESRIADFISKSIQSILLYIQTSQVVDSCLTLE